MHLMRDFFGIGIFEPILIIKIYKWHYQLMTIFMLFNFAFHHFLIGQPQNPQITKNSVFSKNAFFCNLWILGLSNQKRDEKLSWRA